MSAKPTTKEVVFSDKEKCIHNLIFNTTSYPDIGLLYGKMGCSITFYIMSRNADESHRSIYKMFARRILDEVTSSITKNTPFNFAYGLCGIGWAVDYLISSNFIQGDSMVLLEEIDCSVMQINPMRLSQTLEYGLEGVLHYVLGHIVVCKRQSNVIPFDNDYLSELYKCALICKDNSDTTELKKLCCAFVRYMETGIVDYTFDPIAFVDKEKVRSGMSVSSISLSKGLCGYLLIKAE